VNRLIACIVTAVVLWGTAATHAVAEVSEITIAQQYGIAYLQFLVMQRDKLIEKHAKANGLGDVKVSWRKFAGSNVMYDAVFSGDLQIASGGLTPLLTVWSQTAANFKVHGIAAMNTMPLLLNSRDPNVKTLKDLTEKNKIALPAVKISQQAITLEMAAEKAFGPSGFNRLDALTVSMSHPDGMAAFLAKAGEITEHLSAPPFQYQELADPRVHTVFSSTDITGRPTTFTVLWTTTKFREQNPRAYKSVFDAFKEATDIVNADKKAAAELYVTAEHANLPAEEVYKMLIAPGMEYTMTPSGVMDYAEFMFAHGLIKKKPASWKDVFFPEVQDLPGN